MRVFEELIELGFERAAVFHCKIVEQAVGGGEDDGNLFLDRQRRVLRLLQNFDQAFTAIELGLRSFIEIGAELREGREFAVLREIQTQRAGDLRMALICALPPTRLTERPTLTAGRMLELNRSASR